MIYINECTDCHKCWYDDGVVAYRVQPWERTSSEWSIEPVLCNACFRVSSRAHVLSLSSTPNLKTHTEEGEKIDRSQYDTGNNPQMVSDKKTGGVWWRRLCHTAHISSWLISKFGLVRQPKEGHKND